MNSPLDILETAYGEEITNNLLQSFKEVESNFRLEKWKSSELNSGHFVETVRRIIEFEGQASYTPFNKKLPNFTNQELENYERLNCDESFRLLIPKILKSIYNIRNKRGVAHTAKVSPNKMDATYILYSVKWVFAEIIRIKSYLSFSQTQKMVDEIVEREIELLWKGNGFVRILDPKMQARDKVLVFLFDKDEQSKKELQKSTEIKNTTDFRNILIELNKNVLINFDTDICSLSPTGKIMAEKLINKQNRKTLK